MILIKIRNSCESDTFILFQEALLYIGLARREKRLWFYIFFRKRQMLIASTKMGIVPYIWLYGKATVIY
jgi:hypothetical protein